MEGPDTLHFASRNISDQIMISHSTLWVIIMTIIVCWRPEVAGVEGRGGCGCFEGDHSVAVAAAGPQVNKEMRTNEVLSTGRNDVKPVIKVCQLGNDSRVLIMERT